MVSSFVVSVLLYFSSMYCCAVCESSVVRGGVAAAAPFCFSDPLGFRTGVMFVIPRDERLLLLLGAAGLDNRGLPGCRRAGPTFFCPLLDVWT